VAAQTDRVRIVKTLRHLRSEEGRATSIKRLVPAGSENVITGCVLAKLLQQAWSSVASYFSEQSISEIGPVCIWSQGIC
jgi:hypothetical protein